VSKVATSAVCGMFERREGAARLTIITQPDQGQNLVLFTRERSSKGLLFTLLFFFFLLLLLLLLLLLG
jgi:hypothetical protein